MVKKYLAVVSYGISGCVSLCTDVEAPSKAICSVSFFLPQPVFVMKAGELTELYAKVHYMFTLWKGR